MITLHRLGHTDGPFQLNPDLIVTVESTPDTVLTLATATKIVVAETPEEVRDAVFTWRAKVFAEALRTRRGQRGLSATGGGAQAASLFAVEQAHPA